MTSEDNMVVPRAWWHSIHPRRGGAPVGYAPDPDWAARFDDALARRTEVRDSLVHQQTPPHIAEAGLALLAGSGPVTPLGAAAVATPMLHSGRERRFDAGVIADGWIARHGIEFAVEAGLELADLRYGSGTVRPWQTGTLPVTPGEVGDDETGSEWLGDPTHRLLGRLRAALAAATDETYAALLATLTAHRAGSLRRRVVASFLAPDQQDWVDEDVRALAALGVEESTAVLLIASASSAAQVHLMYQLVAPGPVPFQLFDARMLHTIGEGLGAECLDLFLGWMDGWYVHADARRVLLSVIAALPTDRAFQELIDRVGDKHVPAAIAEAAERFPRRAMRLLAAAPATPTFTEMVRRHAVRHPELVDELAAEAAGRVRALAATVPVAPAGVLPDLLVTPPWTVRRKAVKPVVLPDLCCADEPAIEWQPGEREKLLRGLRQPGDLDFDVQAVAAGLRAGSVDYWAARRLLLEGPVELGTELIGYWQPAELWGSAWWMPQLVARFDVAAHPLVVAVARRSPTEGGAHLMRFTSPEIALLMADWLDRLKSARRIARAWLLRHPAAAARALVPAALAKPGPGRRRAGRALVALAAAGRRDTVLDAARGYGPAAAAAVEQLLDTDPLTLLPAKIPVLPDWLDPAVLRPIRLRDGSGALPTDAVRHVLTMLAMSKLGEPYAGLAVVRDAANPDSLGDFAWSLLECWLTAAAPPGDGWALEAQAVFGDDRTAERLGDLVRQWPYEGAHARTAAGLDVLAELGTDGALTQLHEIATKVKAKAVRARAESKLHEVADGLGLHPEQLADRLVPDLGLSPDGRLTLDFGPRRFVVGFDEQLRPVVTAEDGSRRKDLPKPAASDDPELAAAAQQRFAELKKGARKVATEQVRRLEHAMVVQRRWTGAEFRRLFLCHPLLWRIARRLVWATFDQAGRPVTAVRIAEDRSLADVDDASVTLDDDATVGIPHPVHLGAARATWHEIFADYEILQPFQQLGREIHELTDEERASTRLARFDGVKALSVKVIGLERRGWRRTGQDSGYQSRMERDLPGGWRVIVDLDPGITLGMPTHAPEQAFRDVWICPPDADEWSDDHPTQFSALDPATASEILRDLTDVTH